MTSSFEKSVKGATKIKNAPPKTKYIEHILVATHGGEIGMGEVFRALSFRLRDSTWTVVFKSLITVHLMIREGSPDATLAYLAKHRNILAISSFTDIQTQGRNIRHYATYLSERAKAYRDTTCDWVRIKDARLSTLSVNKGLLRETDIVQHQIAALLKCDVMEDGAEFEMNVFVFRLLTLDLLPLFQALNEGLINILRHFFELSKPDAQRAMGIYFLFTKQTDLVVQYLAVAKQWSHNTRLDVPKLKHAPTNLGPQLLEYLNDPDFEINRRQFLAEVAAKKNNKGSAADSRLTRADAKNAVSSSASPATGIGRADSSASTARPTQEVKKHEPDLIDLIFDSIEEPQQQVGMQYATATATPFQAQPVIQPAATEYFSGGLMPQNSAFPRAFPGTFPGAFPEAFSGSYPAAFPEFPLSQQHSIPGYAQPQAQHQVPPQNLAQFSNAPFYPPQAQSFRASSLGTTSHNSFSNFQGAPNMGASSMALAQSHPVSLQSTPTETNPFRQSVLPTQQTPQQFSLRRQSTNPFSAASPPVQQPYPRPPSSAYSQAMPTEPLQPAPTGTNPFLRNYAGNINQLDTRRQSMGPSVGSQPAGSTNPFRQSSIVAPSAGRPGWQIGQVSSGATSQIETLPLFSRRPEQQHMMQ